MPYFSFLRSREPGGSRLLARLKSKSDAKSALSNIQLVLIEIAVESQQTAVPSLVIFTGNIDCEHRSEQILRSPFDNELTIT